MKSKRFLCLLLVLLMVFSLTPSETRAETTVYFTAVNDQLLPDLSDETMPFWSGGRLYIPSTVITGTDWGFSTPAAATRAPPSSTGRAAH